MGIDGVKTGTSARSGQCLILYANRESEVVRQGQMETVYPRHLMVVLLGSTNRFNEGACAFAARLAAIRSMGGCRSSGRSKKIALIFSRDLRKLSAMMRRWTERRADGRLSFAKGEGEGEGLAGAGAESNPSPWSSPLLRGERRK